MILFQDRYPMLDAI